MGRKRIKQYLMLLLAIGVVAVVASGSGTFASFSAETTNHGNTFSTASLTLGNSVDSGANFCWSDGSGSTANARPNCTAVVNGPNWQPGDAPKTGVVELRNGGSVNGTLSVYAPRLDATGAIVTSPSGAVCQSVAGTAGAHPYAGGGSIDLCGATGLKLTIQEVTDGTGTTNAPAGGCVFPFNGTTDCATTYAGAGQLSSLYDGTANAQALGTLTAGAGNERFFKVSVYYPASAGAGADNAYQNLVAYFDLTWHLVQP